MSVYSDELYIESKGESDIINITEEVEKIVKGSKIKDGAALIFVMGSTAAITAIEYEGGVIEDLKNVFEKEVQGQTQVLG